MVNALTTAKEFKDAGDEAVVIFDGAGTKWVAELSREDTSTTDCSRTLATWWGACSYCAG